MNVSHNGFNSLKLVVVCYPKTSTGHDLMKLPAAIYVIVRSYTDTNYIHSHTNLIYARTLSQRKAMTWLFWLLIIKWNNDFSIICVSHFQYSMPFAVYEEYQQQCCASHVPKSCLYVIITLVWREYIQNQIAILKWNLWNLTVILKYQLHFFCRIRAWWMCLCDVKSNNFGSVKV